MGTVPGFVNPSMNPNPNALAHTNRNVAEGGKRMHPCSAMFLPPKLDRPGTAADFMAGFNQGHLGVSFDSLKSCGRTSGSTANDANAQTSRKLAQWDVGPATGLDPLESPMLGGGSRHVPADASRWAGFRRKEVCSHVGLAEAPSCSKEEKESWIWVKHFLNRNCSLRKGDLA